MSEPEDIDPEVEQLSGEDFNFIVEQMKPCPFCGCKGGDVYVVHFHHWVCACPECDTEGPVRETPQKALEFWNKRSA
jgi:Lar family restriction alleviation protein